MIIMIDNYYYDNYYFFYPYDYCDCCDYYRCYCYCYCRCLSLLLLFLLLLLFTCFDIGIVIAVICIVVSCYLLFVTWCTISFLTWCRIIFLLLFQIIRINAVVIFVLKLLTQETVPGFVSSPCTVA